MDPSHTTGEDYPQIVKALKERFDCQRRVYHMHTQQILQIQSKEFSQEDLTRCHDTLQKHLRGLANNGDGTLEQLVTSIVEIQMYEDTYREWKIFTADIQSTPHCDIVLKFYKTRAASLLEKHRTRSKPLPNII